MCVCVGVPACRGVCMSARVCTSGPSGWGAAQQPPVHLSQALPAPLLSDFLCVSFRAGLQRPLVLPWETPGCPPVSTCSPSLAGQAHRWWGRETNGGWVARARHWMQAGGGGAVGQAAGDLHRRPQAPSGSKMEWPAGSTFIYRQVFIEHLLCARDKALGI